MRKLYIVLLLALILSIILATYDTFFSSRSIIVSSPTESIEPTPISTRTPNGPAISPNDFYVRSERTFNGVTMALVNFSEVDQNKLLEVINGKYYLLGDDYQWVNPYMTTRTDDFWFDTNNKKLYLTKYNGEEGTYADESDIILVDYSDSLNIKPITLATVKNRVYGGAGFIDYSPEYNSFLMESNGGDACSGWGTIYTFNLSTKARNDLVEHASNCMEGLRYFGYENKRLMFGEPIKCDSEWTMSGSCLKSIYSVDPFNLRERKIIYTFSAPYEFDEGYTEEKISSDEVVISKPMTMPDSPDGLKNYTWDTYVLNLKSGSLRAVNVEESSTSFYPEPVEEVLSDGSLIRITRLGHSLSFENKSDEYHAYKIITRESASDTTPWTPCDDGCMGVAPGEIYNADLSGYLNKYSATIYWWSNEINPISPEEIPENNRAIIYPR